MIVAQCLAPFTSNGQHLWNGHGQAGKGDISQLSVLRRRTAASRSLQMKCSLLPGPQKYGVSLQQDMSR